MTTASQAASGASAGAALTPTLLAGTILIGLRLFWLRQRSVVSGSWRWLLAVLTLALAGAALFFSGVIS